MVRAEQTDGRQPRTWPSGDRTPAEAVVGRIQDRIFRAAKIKRPRLEPDDEQSSCPVLRGLGSGNGARLPDGFAEEARKMHMVRSSTAPSTVKPTSRKPRPCLRTASKFTRSRSCRM